MSHPTLIATNPATGERLAEIPMATPAEVKAARVEMARVAPIWRSKPLKERTRILRQLQKVLVDAVDEITATINLDTGKSRQDALIELFITLDLLNDYLRHAPRWLAPEPVNTGLYMFKKAYVERRPYGVAAVIAPWNYPFVLTVPPVLTALLAGNTVLLKPSEETAYVGRLIETLFNRVPELAPFVTVLHGDGRVGAALVDAKPDLIFITGSTATGRKVLQAAADHLIPVISELGGKDPLIVLEDADVEAAARWGVWGACFNAGQTCMAVERVYVVDAVYDEFVRHAVHYAEQFKVGYSSDTDAPYLTGPLTTARQVDIVDRHLADARAKGATVLVGGERHGRFVEPTILVDVTPDMLVLHEETFGPLMPIVRVADEADAIRHANDCRYGLGASIWSRDLARAQAVAGQIEAGTLQINDVLSHFAITKLPFGGVKQSGRGRVHGREDLLQFTQMHAYTVAQAPSPLDVSTHLRLPGNYALGAAGLRTLFGVTPQQRLQPLVTALRQPAVRRLGRQARRGAQRAGQAAAVAGAIAGVATWIARTARQSRR